MQLSCSVSPIPKCKSTKNLFPVNTKMVFIDETCISIDKTCTSIDEICIFPYTLYIYMCASWSRQFLFLFRQFLSWCYLVSKTVENRASWFRQFLFLFRQFLSWCYLVSKTVENRASWFRQFQSLFSPGTKPVENRQSLFSPETKPVFCNYLKINPKFLGFDLIKKAAVFLKNPPPFLENLPRFLENLPTF